MQMIGPWKKTTFNGIYFDFSFMTQSLKIRLICLTNSTAALSTGKIQPEQVLIFPPILIKTT